MNTGSTSIAPIAAHYLRARWRWATLHGDRLRRYQARRAHAIVAHAWRHARFYREHWAGYDRRDWQRLPLVDKRLMMEHFDTFNTLGIRRDDALALALRAEQSRDFSPTLGGVTVGLSSGTSGHRGLFLVSPQEQAAWAGTILARTLHHRIPRRLTVAFFLRSNSNLYERTGGTLIQFRYVDLMTPLAEAVALLNRLAPNIIVGPPSLLVMLSAARERGDLRVQPERLISVAEVLDEADHACITTAFDAPLHQIYQCTEGLLAVSCAAGSLHVQEDLVALQLERLPNEGDHPDKISRYSPIVTDLWRTTQPIIRYRLNDVLRMSSQPCQCGSDWRVIDTIEGRADDIVYFVATDGTPRPFFPDTIRRMILLASSGIADYQALQGRTGELRIHLQVASGVDFDAVAAAVRTSVTATVAHYRCRPPLVVVEPGIPPRPPAAKRRRVWREPGAV